MVDFDRQLRAGSYIMERTSKRMSLTISHKVLVYKSDNFSPTDIPRFELASTYDNQQRADRDG